VSAKQFDRLREVLVKLREIPASDRAAWLDRECAGDAELRREVESLLEFDSHQALPAFAQTGGVHELIKGSSERHSAHHSLPSRVGDFDVVGELGRGGMGIVLRARDTRLGREVALKILPEAFAGHPERLARFSREAQLLAAINHPNIAQIYGLERLDGTSALVMELVEGESLAERLLAGPVDLPEALAIARQVAEAVEAAHDRGIVHRDLKPGNIMVGPRGRVKVLDFGLAKALDPEVDAAGHERSERPGTSYQSASTPEFILGTPAYMSPEQLRRVPVTRRADVWAFGCICFELLTGKAAFARGTLLDTMTAVLTTDPDWSLLPQATPTPLRQLLRRCLHKDETERLRELGDVRILLEEMASDPAGLPRTTSAVRSAGRRWLVLVAGSLAAFSAGLFLARRLPTKAPDPVYLKELTASGRDSLPAVSPNGRQIALVSDRDGRSRIWIKDLATGAEEPVTEGDDTLPQFSPDGAALLFVRAENGRQSVYRQPFVGGHAMKVVDSALEGCWSPSGGRIAFIRRRKGIGGVVAMVSLHGGAETRLYESDRQVYGVRWSQRENEIVVVESPPNGKSAGYHLVLINPDDEQPPNHVRRLPISGPVSAPSWIGAGRQLLYAHAGSDLGDLGDPVSRILLHDLDEDQVRTLFFAEGLFPLPGQWSLGRATSLGVVAPGSVILASTTVSQTLRETAPAGAPARTAVPRGGRRDRQPAYSPDGNQLLFSSDRFGNLDLWLFDFRYGSLRQLTDDKAQDWDPAFTSDGQRVLWSSNRTGHLEIWSMSVDGSEVRRITNDGEDAENPSETADGAWIVYWSANPAKAGIWRIRPDGTEPVLLVPGNYSIPEISPDGRWAAFRSQQPADRRTVLGVVEVASGRTTPFQITIAWPADQAERLVLGRTRFIEDPTPTLAYVGVDEQGRSGIFTEAFDPNGNSHATRRPFAGFSDDWAVDSFGLSRDGRYATISQLKMEQSVKIANGVPDVVPAGGKDSR
jgi:serine/threonine protein kinase/Tol biopolymer transport system component